jgi:hypothetical protein
LTSSGTLQLDGSSYAALPNDLIRTYENSETIEASFQTTSGGVILGYQDSDPASNPYWYIPVLYVGNDGLLRGEFWTGSVNPLTSSATVNDANWHHLALVFDGQAQVENLYLDGQLVGSFSGVGIQDLPVTFDQIGTGYSLYWPGGAGGWFGFQGQIDDVQIWSEARSASEIQSDMSSPPTGATPGLVAYYPFDEGSGLTAHDLSGNQNDAAIVASPSLPIDLGGDGPTPNAPAPRQGPNNLQNYPIVVTTADGRMEGWLYGSTPNTQFRIEFFASAGFAPGGSGEAEMHLGSIEVTTDGSGQVVFDSPFAPPGDKPIVTATATDPDGNTSEVSAIRQTGIQIPTGYVGFRPGSPVTLSSAMGDAIGLEDPGAGPLDALWNITISVPASTGTLTLATLVGLTGTGNGTATLQYVGGLAELNAALDGLRFTPDSSLHGKVLAAISARSTGARPLQSQVAFTDGVYKVTTTADAGPGSLRQAILDAIATIGPASVSFAIAGSGVQTIALASPLLALPAGITIDGTTQPGYAGSPLIEIDGQNAGVADGLKINVPNTTIRGLAIDGFGRGAAIVLSGPNAAHNSIYANVLGVEPSSPLSPGNEHGVVIRAGAHDNTIGTDNSGQEANVISGNSSTGVMVEPWGLDGSGGFGVTAAGLVLSGSASMQGGRLRLTDGGYSEAGSAFSPEPLDITRFSTRFEFQLTNASADGFTFTIQGNGPSALGGGGGSLGYAGIGKSVAVKFDLWNNDGEGPDSTGLYLDGAGPFNAGSIDLRPTGIDLHSGDIFEVTLNYDGGTLALGITDTQTGTTASQSYQVDIPGTVGGPTAYVGFTGGTGGATAIQDILNWGYPAPEPQPVGNRILGNAIFGNGADVLGHALGFDGTGSYVQLPSFPLGGAITVEAWVESENVYANYARVVDFGVPFGGSNIILNWVGTSGQMSWGINDQSGGWQSIQTSAVFPQGQWVHVAATVDAQGNGAIYWDDQLVAAGFVGVPPVESRPDQYVAQSNWSSDSALSGAIGDVQIWSVARTADEIRGDMTAALAGNEPGLVAYYKFDERQGTTARDATPNQRDATLATTGTNLPSWGGQSIVQAIDLGGVGGTPNAAAPRQGPNNLQNYPIVVTTADGSIQGWLYGSAPSTQFRIEFFASAGFAPGGSGEAEIYLGATEVTTDGSGQVVFDVPFVPPADKPIVTATATDPEGNTSELSVARQSSLSAPTGYVRFAGASSLTIPSATGGGIVLHDADAGPLDPAWDLTLSVPTGAGIISLSTLAGLAGTGNGTDTLHYHGGIVELNQALEGLSFTPSASFPGVINLTVGAQPIGSALFQAQFSIGDGIYLVNTTADSGDGSLRQAILSADALPSPATITFVIPGGGIQTIAPVAALPVITKALVMDGTTQPGYSGSALIAFAVAGADSLSLSSADVTLRGVSIGSVAFTGASGSGSVRLKAVPVAATVVGGSGGREDTYGIVTTTGGQLVALVHPSGLTVQLSLLDDQGRRLALSDGVSATDPDTVIDEYLPPGSYTIAVLCAGTGGTYDLTASFLANPNATFPQPNQFATGIGPISPVVGDFTGDGRLDIAVVNSGSHDISLLLGNGDGTFQPERRIPVPGNAPLTTLVAGDFNGDGRLDLVANGYILLGNGDGTFQTRPVPTIGSSFVLAAGDFSRDGKLDLVELGPTSLGILVGRGDGTFFPERQITAESADEDAGRHYIPSYDPRDSLIVADLDNNGKLDLVVPIPGISSIQVIYGNGDGTFQVPRLIGVDGVTVQGLIATHFGNSGLVDLWGYAGGTQVFITNHGGGNFSIWRETPGAQYMPAFSADLNGDGVPDLVDNQSVVLDYYPGQAHGLEPRIAFPAPFSTRLMVAADFSGNGRLDVAGVNTAANNITVLVANGDGTFSDAGAASVAVHDSPVLADFTGDGAPDLVTIDASGLILFRQGRPGEPGTFDPLVEVNPGHPARDITYVMTNEGPMLAAVDATDNQVSIYHYRDGNLVLASSLPTGQLPAQIAAADLTGNGLDDLIIHNAGDGTLTIYLGEKLVGPTDAGYDTPTLVPGGSINVGLGVSGFTLADTLGRGVLDIVVTNEVTGQVSVLLNQGGLSFGAPMTYRAGTGPAWLGTSQDGSLAVGSADATSNAAAGEFTQGGPRDLVAVNPGTNTIATLAGLGEGRFANPRTITTASPPLAVRVADLNHDGIPDLAVLTEGGVSVYLGDGRGGFSAPVTYDTGSDATGLSIADINHDGNLDLLVGNTHGDVLILVNQGNGTFAPYRKADEAITLAVADLTGNGSKDVIYADQGLDRVVVAYGQGESTVLGDRSTGVLEPGAVKLADLNGDGIPDLIVANSGSNNVLVYPGLGNGQFGPALNDGHGFFTGENPVEVTVADVNGDGRPDLIVANKGSNDVSILLNQPNGSGFTFTPGPRLPAGAGPVDTIVQDVLGNGKPDLLVSDSQSNSVMLLPGIGGGFFSEAQARTFRVGSQPGPLFVGNFDGKPDLVTVNAGSNDLTLISNFTGEDPVTITISSGGLDPVTAFAFGDTSGFADLVVANNGDGALALFEGGPEGLTLFSTQTTPELPSPTALAFSALSGGQVQFYAATEGREAAILVALSLAGESGLLPSPGALVPSIPENVAQLVAVSESSLALVGSLLVVTLESPVTDLNFGSAEIAGAANTGSFAAGPGAPGQSLIGQAGNGFREDTQDPGARPEQPPVTIVAPRAMPWERYVLGIDEALERYNREHQDKSPEARDNSGDSSPNKGRHEGGSAKGEPADSPLKAGFLRNGLERREAVDEAIDSFVGERWRRIEAIEIQEGFIGGDVGAMHPALQRGEAIEIRAPGNIHAPSHRPGAFHPSFHRHSRSRVDVSGALIFGTVVAGWAHRGWSKRRTLARHGPIARRK